MKKRTTLFKKALFALGLIFIVQGAMAVTFTAVTSGNWTSEATWGGEAPGDIISSDDIIIPEGLTVYLDTDVTLDGVFSSINVDGALQATGDNQLIIASGGLEGEGSLNLSYLEFQTLGSMSFNGMAEVDKLVNRSASLVLSSTLNITDTLSLEDGNVLLDAGSTLGMLSESAVKVNEGTVTIGTGLFSADNPYTLIYLGTEKNAGIEANGSGLTDLYVELDDNTQSIMLSGDVNVNGNIYQESGNIDLNGGNLTINGNYTSNAGAEIIGDENSDLTINSTSELSSTLIFSEENEMINNLTISGDGEVNIVFGSELDLMGDLMVENATMTLDGDNTFMVAENSNLVLNNGELLFTGGALFNGDASYNVAYTGESNTAGLELSGSGLNHVTINLGVDDDEVKLASNTQIHGTLKLNGGDLDMNGYDIMLMGDFQGNTNAELQGHSESSLAIITAGDLSDTINFDSEAREIDELTLNLTGSGEVIIGSHLYVQNVNMEEGMLVLTDGNLEVASTGTISGTDANNYISTTGLGYLFLTLNVDAPYMLYPVGNEDGYSPAMIQIENGTAGTFGVNVMGEVLTDGTIGDDVTLTESVVDRTWNVSEGTGTSTDINLMLSWSSSMELNGFNNEEAYITHYTEGNWDVSAFTSATYNAEMDMYEMERQGITSLSPFAVKDGNSNLSIEDMSTLAVISAYPNPATDIVFLDLSNTEGRVDYAIMNKQGQLINNFKTIQGGSIITLDMSKLPSGLYFIQVVEGDNVITEKVIKS